MAAMQAECARLGIRWLPQRFRPRPKVIAPALSMLRMVWLLRREVRGQGARLISCAVLHPGGGGDDRVAAGGGALHLRYARALARRAYYRRTAKTWLAPASCNRCGRTGLFAQRGCSRVADPCRGRLLATRIPARPCRAKNHRYPPPAPISTALHPHPTRLLEPVVHGCIGTILSGWFRTDWLAAWLATAAQVDPDVRFDIVTRDDAGRVRAAIDPRAKLGDRLTIASRPSEEMPDALHSHDLSVMFFTDGLSKLGSAPTRMAEVLGSGLPIVANEGVGDVADILRRHRVGVIVDGPCVRADKCGFR